MAAGVSVAAEKTFVPDVPTISTGALKQGERGTLKTVLRGTEPTTIPVEVVSVIPQKGEVDNAILIRFLPNSDDRAGGVAHGMSGSPLYVRGKLAGALGSGWDFGDHTLALVTPIDAMCAVFSRDASRGGSGAASVGGSKARKKSALQLASPVSVSGLSPKSAAALGRALGTSLAAAPSASKGELLAGSGTLRAGDSVAALLAWGDIVVAAAGTVTATSKDGRFLAFGHPFLKRGSVAFPAGRAYVHETVRNQSFPFKLFSLLSLVGTVTQDREAGIGGRVGYFAPSISASLVFRDADQGRREERNFRVVPDAFLSAKLLETIYTGLLEDVWGRRGQGTMMVTLRIEGRGVRNGWTREDVFFSDEDVGAVSLKQAVQIMNAFLLQPFEDVMPLGFRLEVEATEDPQLLFIEDVEAPDHAKPGEEIPVTVTLRPWRGKPVTHEFTLTVPESASGVYELIVRGGGVQPLPQLALEGGWKSIDGLNRMLDEIAAMDANNELVVELTGDTMAEVLRKSGDGAKDSRSDRDNKDNKDKKEDRDGKSAKDKDDREKNSRGELRGSHTSPELLPEETEFLSETKERRIREGTLRILRANRYVDGMMRRLVSVEDDLESEDGEPQPEMGGAVNTSL